MVKRTIPLVAQTLDFSCGAACFAAMHRYFFNSDHGAQLIDEMDFAKRLGNLELGYTDPRRIVDLAQDLGLKAVLHDACTSTDLFSFVEASDVSFVTWWDEDAGHYSLVAELDQMNITLMDPLTAREGRLNKLNLEFFIENWRLRGAKVISVNR